MLRLENRKSLTVSPEEDKYYSMSGSVVGLEENCGNGKLVVENGGEENRGAVWQKLYISLSSKGKKKYFMVMKECKLPQRPKKRAKIVQKGLASGDNDRSEEHSSIQSPELRTMLHDPILPLVGADNTNTNRETRNT